MKLFSEYLVIPYIYIVIHRQTVLFYQNSSVTLEDGIETRPTSR